MKTISSFLISAFSLSIVLAQNFEITHELEPTDVSGTTIYYSNLTLDTIISTNFSLINHSGTTQEVTVKRFIIGAPNEWTDHLSLEPIPDPTFQSSCYPPNEFNPWTTPFSCTVHNNEMAKLSINIQLLQTIGEGTYRYYFMNGSIVLDSVDVSLSMVLSTESLLTQKSIIFPNPSKNKIYFSGNPIYNVRIYDLNGKVVFESSTIEDNAISIASLENGTYSIVLTTAIGIHSEKLVIHK